MERHRIVPVSSARWRQGAIAVDRPRRVAHLRLMAIRSLGTLGVADVLPFLILYSQEEDGEIAGAARAAVQAINDKGGE